VVRFYAADGSILPFNAPIATGTAAIREVWSSLVSKPGYSLTLSPMKITVAASRDIAWELGTFELKLNDAQGKPTAIPGKYLVTWTKIDGAWKVSADVFNTDN
jgi:ketosteroid isomerase-like protein